MSGAEHSVLGEVNKETLGGVNLAIYDLFFSENCERQNQKCSKVI